MTIRVLLADDQRVIRSGLAMMLGIDADIDVVAQAEDGEQALQLAKELRPDVCLLDIRMPKMNGIEVTEKLTALVQRYPEDYAFSVVIITTFDLDEYVYAALKAGAKGFILKDVGQEMLVQAVKAAAHGDALIAPHITARLLSTFARQSSANSTTTVTHLPSEPLTKREEDVLLLVSQGLTNQEIAEKLFVSLSTVKTHLTNLTQKLAVRNRVEMTIWAYQTGRIS